MPLVETLACLLLMVEPARIEFRTSPASSVFHAPAWQSRWIEIEGLSQKAAFEVDSFGLHLKWLHQRDFP
jgi:hypothetical protein